MQLKDYERKKERSKKNVALIKSDKEQEQANDRSELSNL